MTLLRYERGPDGRLQPRRDWRYVVHPVEDSKDLKGKGSKVDKLSDDWTATAIEAPKEEPKEEPVTKADGKTI